MKNGPPRVSRNPMPSEVNQSVIIVGAGPVGLVTATLLVEQGIPVVLIEACSELPHDLRASTFHPPTLDMLERLAWLPR
jgi:3-(3-hydroxy-phenyl)propionate hydroxylase